jgi:hypothetical protein
MRSKQRGYFFMINNVNFLNAIQFKREGSELDEKNLGALFKDLEYEVETHRDQGLEVNVSVVAYKLQCFLSSWVSSFGVQFLLNPIILVQFCDKIWDVPRTV